MAQNKVLTDLHDTLHFDNRQDVNGHHLGTLDAGEMGCGIKLHNVNPQIQEIRDSMYRMHGFDEYISEKLGTQEAKQLYLVLLVITGQST